MTDTGEERHTRGRGQTKRLTDRELFESRRFSGTAYITVDRDSFTDGELLIAAETVRSGGLCVFPTETVYGIGADATDSRAAEKIYRAKGRPSDNPLIIHVSSPSETERYAVTCPLYYRLASQFMPGPLTVIMPRRGTIPKTVTGGLETVAVRCPSHPVANALIRLAGVPIAAPSANISGRPSATSAEFALRDFAGRADVIIDGGDADFGLESTIVRITGDDSVELLRPGAVTRDALLCVCGEVTVSPGAAGELPADERPVCPGMKYRHYAPSKPLALVRGDMKSRTAFFAEQAKRGGIIICYDEQLPQIGGEAISLGSEKDLLSQGHLLFSALRRADTLPGDRIFANMPPVEEDEGGLGLALYNRLIRAAAHTVVNAGPADSAPDGPGRAANIHTLE